MFKIQWIVFEIFAFSWVWYRITLYMLSGSAYCSLLWVQWLCKSYELKWCSYKRYNAGRNHHLTFTVSFPLLWNYPMKSPQHSALYYLRYWQCPLINHKSNSTPTNSVRLWAKFEILHLSYGGEKNVRRTLDTISLPSFFPSYPV